MCDGNSFPSFGAMSEKALSFMREESMEDDERELRRCGCSDMVTEDEKQAEGQ